MTGKVMFAMPTFEVNSVMVPHRRHTSISIRRGGKCRSGSIDAPTFFAMQEATAPLEIANPPPNRKIIPHGILVSMTFHVIKPSEERFGLLLAVDFAIFRKSRLY